MPKPLPPSSELSAGIADAASSKGEAKVWLAAAGLAVGLLMIGGLLLLIAWNGVTVFWPKRVTEFTLKDGSVCAGVFVKEQVRQSILTGKPVREKQVFVGNRDALGLAFRFLDEHEIQSTRRPLDILVGERMEYGKALFFPVRLELANGEKIEASDEAFADRFQSLISEGNARRARIRALEKGEIGDLNIKMKRLDSRLRKLDAGSERDQRVAERTALDERYLVLSQNVAELRREQLGDRLVMRLADGMERSQEVTDFLSFYAPNRLSNWQRTILFLRQIWNFLSLPPREANTEGGIFPAIFGTFVMTLLMAALVTPLGVVAAIYLHEYAKHGLLLQVIRICVNNLAGVPSIVFGVFGLGFFVYGLGGFIDGGPENSMPAPWWYAVSFGAIGSLITALMVSSHNQVPVLLRPKNRLWVVSESLLWVLAIVLFVVSLAKCPFFEGFYADALPSPTFGTGGILWASLTLALMTLPVVIVATEEALSSVPRGVREAALACGASKWQMIQRIALPGALPGVMTGVILAMARGAGEVAPLMITGVVKLAPSLPLDTTAPFIHPTRKFMHLGFHIFDLGFQSPDSEAAKPMVFATTLLLILLVVVLNLAAIQIRTHLRRKYQASAF